MAAGKASIDFMVENSLPSYVEELGNYFMKELKSLEQKETKTPGSNLCTVIRDEICKNGVISETGGQYSNVLRFLPPLILTRA